jgi:hypothetical protein
MRSKVVRTLALALMLCGINLVMGQQNPQGVDEKQKDLRGKEDADRARLIASLKNKGELSWPESLRLSAFKDSREQLSALMRRVYKSVGSGNNPDPATLNDLQAQYRKLRDILQKSVNEMKPDEYIEAQRYLTELGQTITALPDPNSGHQSSGANKGIVKAAPPEKSRLEEMLTEALKHNPDIRVAAAKLAEADAELNRSRLLVTQKVVMLYYAIETQKKTVAHQEARYKRVEQMIKSATVSAEDAAEARQALALAKGKLEELEAQLPALLGKSAHEEADDRDLRAAAVLALKFIGQPQDSIEFNKYLFSTGVATQNKATGPMAERLRKALQTPVKVDYKEEMFALILKDLERKVDGLSFRNLFERLGPGNHPAYSIHFEEALPVSAILQALADESGCFFFVRDYGILAIKKDNAPPGAMTVEEFLRHKPADESRRPSGDGKNPPAESVEGVVKSVDASGLMTISIGSDAGLAQGQTLELFWMPHKPPINDARSLGTVSIVEAEAHQSVARPLGRLAHTPQPGDRIIGNIKKK